jgi:hypothetical protein
MPLPSGKALIQAMTMNFTYQNDWVYPQRTMSIFLWQLNLLTSIKNGAFPSRNCEALHQGPSIYSKQPPLCLKFHKWGVPKA